MSSTGTMFLSLLYCMFSPILTDDTRNWNVQATLITSKDTFFCEIGIICTEAEDGHFEHFFQQ
jgi:hypothetical protein